MPCLLAIFALAFPRVLLIVLWVFTNYVGRAYNTFTVPLLGLFFLPLTTLTYAWLVNSGLPIQGLYLFLLIVAVLIDAGTIGGAQRRRKE